MAEGFEVYHVPQQSRRDKLRIGATAAATPNNNNNFHISSSGLLPLYDPSLISTDFLSVSSQDFHHPLPINQTPFHNINSSTNPSLYGGGYGGDEFALFKHHHHQEPLSLELNLQRYGSSAAAAIFTSSINVTNDSDSIPLGPFTGYASILKGSKFLKPAQLLLEELFDYGGRLGNNAEKLVTDSNFMDPLLENLDGDIASSDHDPMSCSSDDGNENRRKKSRLISMLDEVYRRYKQYYQQMQAVVTTFEYVAGLGNAAPYVNLAVKTMFKHFRLLKNAIADQLHFNNNNNKPYNPYCQRSVHNAAGFLDHHQPVWRPQRGLPESAVTVLRAWLFEHFLHPYPTDTDKLMLANQTGLSRSQVSNWFINARVRLWKPMVEEIHMLETRQAAQKSQQREGGNSGNRLNNDHASSTTSLKPGQNASASISNQDQAADQHTRNELIHEMSARKEPLNTLSNPNIFSTHTHAAAGASMGNGGGGNVSLTLGLHQNNLGIGLTEPYPINAVAAQHFNFGLEGNGEGFVMNGFVEENRHFGRNGMGGQLLHDFIG